MAEPDKTDELVSVLLFSYNQGQFLREALESALSQTWQPLEVVVVDNGSTDDSRSVLEDFADDPRIILRLHDRNGPITARMNEAVRIARGDWVSFLFSDDLYRPEKIADQVRAARAAATPPGVVYAPTIVEDVRTGATSVSPSVAASGCIFEDLMLRHFAGPIEMIAALIRRQALVEHPFHEDLFTEGEGIFFRLALYAPFLFVDRPLAVSRYHSWNMGKAVVRNRDWLLRMHDKLRSEPGLEGPMAPLVDIHEALILRSCAWQGARLGIDRDWVRNCLRRAAARDPRSLSHPQAAAAAALALVPPPLAALINRVGDRLAPDRHRMVVDDYGGISDGR
ncbi:MAG: glycosyltransferase [Chloroflexota bacterium]|nr:glycosyltransferase [Chloroflexota bacterium]